MRPFSSALAVLILVSALPAASAQGVTAQMRARAVANCNANRGTDCKTEAGLKEWIDAERPPAPGHGSAIQMQKLEAGRKAQQKADTNTAPR